MTDIEGVIIGGAIAITGSLIGPLILERRMQLYARLNKRRDKYEEFIKTSYENDHRSRTLHRARIAGTTENELPPPEAKLKPF